MSVKYIFCISTGRCGTSYLTQLFGALNDCSAHHEHQPLLNNTYMRAYLNGDKKPVQSAMLLKVEKITTNGSQLYVDTSHIFIKSFGWEIPNYIREEDLGVIILKRPRKQVVKSTLRVHSDPFSYKGRRWIIVPHRNTLIRPPISYRLYSIYRYMLKIYWALTGENSVRNKNLPFFFKKTSIKLVEWYYQETYAMGELYKKQYPKIHYFDTTLEELNTLDGFKNVLKYFRLEHLYNAAKTEAVVAKRTNIKL